MMYTEMYIDGEEKGKKNRMAKAGGIILWILLIGISVFFTLQSMAV